MSSPNRCGISFSSFSSFIDSSGACLESIYEGVSRTVDGVVGAGVDSADAFSYASANYSMDRGPSGFVSDYLALRRFQEMSREFAPFTQGFIARFTELRTAGIGPLVCLETGARICSVPDPGVDCSIMSAPDCELFCAPEENLPAADVVEPPPVGIYERLEPISPRVAEWMERAEAARPPTAFWMEMREVREAPLARWIETRRPSEPRARRAWDIDTHLTAAAASLDSIEENSEPGSDVHRHLRGVRRDLRIAESLMRGRLNSEDREYLEPRYEELLGRLELLPRVESE